MEGVEAVEGVEAEELSQCVIGRAMITIHIDREVMYVGVLENRKWPYGEVALWRAPPKRCLALGQPYIWMNLPAKDKLHAQ